MSLAYVNARIEERARLAAMIEKTLERCEKDGRDPTPEERSQNGVWAERVAVLDTEITELRAQLDSNERFEKTVGHLTDMDEKRERREHSERDNPAQTEVRLADAFTASPAFTEYRGRGTSQRFEVEDIFGIESRAALGTTEVFPPKARWDGLAGPAIVTPFLDLINRERVSTGSFDYVKWPQATGVLKVAEKAAKPEVALLPTLATLSLDTYAGWVQVTRQALEDVPRIRSQIETRLRQALARALEAAAVAALEAGGVVDGGGVDLAGIRSAAATIEGAGYRPTAIAMSPADAGILDIAVMGATVQGPSVQGSLWGLRVVPVPSLDPGTAYVADWAQAETWFDRGTTDIFLTDSHADSFIKNIFVILAEARAQFAVTDVAAVASVGITQPPVIPLEAATIPASK